jgi:hypothetical protein
VNLDLPPIQSFEEFEAETLPLLQRQFRFSDRLRARLSHEVMTTKVQRDWIVKGCLQARSFHLIIGTPGCGKSFLTLDLCMNLALAAVDKTHSGLWFGKNGNAMHRSRLLNRSRQVLVRLSQPAVAMMPSPETSFFMFHTAKPAAQPMWSRAFCSKASRNIWASNW